MREKSVVMCESVRQTSNALCLTQDALFSKVVGKFRIYGGNILPDLLLSSNFHLYKVVLVC